MCVVSEFEEFDGLVRVDSVSGHEDALCLFDERTAFVRRAERHESASGPVEAP